MPGKCHGPFVAAGVRKLAASSSTPGPVTLACNNCLESWTTLAHTCRQQHHRGWPTCRNMPSCAELDTVMTLARGFQILVPTLPVAMV